MIARPRHDRWLLSYADFVTLLFAMFVVLYATAKAQEQKTSVAPPVNRPALPALESNVLTDLQAALHLEQLAKKLTISTDPRGVVLALDERICFRPGDASVQPEGAAIFEKVGRSLSRHQNRILLVGHTDSQPIHNAQFQSNWELSSARSIEVMRLMEKVGLLDESRFVIQGSADKLPLSKEDSNQGRAQNRRVDIIVLNDNQPMGIL